MLGWVGSGVDFQVWVLEGTVKGTQNKIEASRLMAASPYQAVQVPQFLGSFSRQTTASTLSKQDQIGGASIERSAVTYQHMY